MSPRSQQRQVSDAQRQLFAYQRELLNQQSRGPSAVAYVASPKSPRLQPSKGDPGPVTPLELEGEGYLSAGATGQKTDVDKIIQKEKKRAENSPYGRSGSS